MKKNKIIKKICIFRKNSCTFATEKLFININNHIMSKDCIDINGCKIFVENGEIKTILNEEIQKTGYMNVDTAFEIIHKAIDKQYEL